MTQVEFIVYVKDQERSRNFYSAILKKEPILDVPGMTEFSLLENCKLGIMPEKGIAKILKGKTPDPSIGSGIPRCELYLSSSDVAKDFQEAINAGADPISEPKNMDWGDTVAYVADPDGHIIAFAKRY